MRLSIKYWFIYKWRKFKGICLSCGRSPVNNRVPITVDPFYSDTHCRGCMKIYLFASNYGMGTRRLKAIIDRALPQSKSKDNRVH